VESPVVGLNAFITVTVHEITSLIRTTVDEVLVWPMHDSVDDAVGVPSTANENVLPVITLPPLSFSVMANTAVITVGAVTKKLNVEPELVVTNVGDPAPLGPNTGTMKSDEIATEAPAASLTVTVHEITSLTRTYVVPAFSCPTHDRVDDTVADVTLKVRGLAVRAMVPLKSFSVI